MAPVDTVKINRGFQSFFTLNIDLTRMVKHFVHVTPYYSLADDTNNYKISYDTKTLMWRTCFDGKQGQNCCFCSHPYVKSIFTH